MSKKLKTFDVNASIIGGKYLGQFKAKNKKEAIELALNSSKAYISLCHQCCKECSDPQIDKLFADEVEEK